MNFFKKIGNKIKSAYHWVLARKIHIIPVFLFIKAVDKIMNAGHSSYSAVPKSLPGATGTSPVIISYDDSQVLYTVAAAFLCCIFYYVVVLFPDFYREWKKKHPKEI